MSKLDGDSEDLDYTPAESAAPYKLAFDAVPVMTSDPGHFSHIFHVAANTVQPGIYRLM